MLQMVSHCMNSSRMFRCDTVMPSRSIWHTQQRSPMSVDFSAIKSTSASSICSLRQAYPWSHHQFDEAILDKGTQAILKTRDGKLRAAVPNPLGSCVFLNDVTQEELCSALRKHKQCMKGYPRNGEGIDAFVDAGDTGFTMKSAREGCANQR